jgi:FkbH-like protein
VRNIDLYWLVEPTNLRDWLNGLPSGTPGWSDLVSAAGTRLDFIQTARLDNLRRRFFPLGPTADIRGNPVRLATLGNSTFDHLVPGLRVGALRRGMWLDVYTCNYGQSLQELSEPTSSLHRFNPNTALFSFDYQSLVGKGFVGLHANEVDQIVRDIIERLRGLWELAAKAGCRQIIQQTVIPSMPNLLGNNEHRLAWSPRRLVDSVNTRLREAADANGVDVLSLDSLISDHGLDAWHDPALWHRAKQEISPAASPLYGDMVGRLLAARLGLAAKCLILDLDNTLWGGTIGDDGLGGIVLGQGSAQGEAYLAFQSYAKQLAERGVILAVCSKNDEENALAPFNKHPEMILKQSDIGCFVANWDDKATNVRRIASALNIGMDSLVFADDNPFERNIVRRELPAVAVPELPEDPSLYARCLADAGYFEAIRLTENDLNRSQQYQENLKRDALRASSTDLAGYLKSLAMRLEWKRFDPVGLQRIVQLINKTNQFNLTTRRYHEAAVTGFMNDPRTITLQLRLTDQLGDNGIIAVVIAFPMDSNDVEYKIDTWLMSCRVLGRQVEQATLNLLASIARRNGARKLIGEYRKTANNSMVSQHYERLGFSRIEEDSDGNSRWCRSLEAFTPFSTHIDTIEGAT